VQEKQLLAEIDPVLADTALTSANATLENMTAQRAAKQAQLVLAKAERDRNDTLFAKRFIAANDRDISQANYDAAFADAASLAAQMKQATAAVDTAKANRGYTTITAPMAGEVVSITTLEGQTLNANQQAPTILRIADISTVTIWAQVSEADIVRVKPARTSTSRSLARRGAGTARSGNSCPRRSSSTTWCSTTCSFDIPNPDGELKIQMTAQVFIVLAQAKASC